MSLLSRSPNDGIRRRIAVPVSLALVVAAVVACGETVDVGGPCAGQVAPLCSPAPAGCTRTAPVCANETLACGTVQCPGKLDAGVDATKAITGVDASDAGRPDGDCRDQVCTTLVPDGCAQGSPVCVDGTLQCPVTCRDSGLTMDAGSDAPDSGHPCGDIGITFLLNYSGILCPGSVCSEDWLSITGPDDASVPALAGFPMVPCSECGECEANPANCLSECPILPGSAGPWSFVWNGQTHPTSMCPSGSQYSCTTDSCATPGAYTATICAHTPAAEAGTEGCDTVQPQPTCKTLSFQWPPTQSGETVSWTP